MQQRLAALAGLSPGGGPIDDEMPLKVLLAMDLRDDVERRPGL